MSSQNAAEFLHADDALKAFEITGDPLCLANIRASAAASKEVYDRPNISSGTGESALIQDCGDCSVAAFPGTHDVHDVLDDIDCLRRAVLIAGKPCEVHKGFDDSFQALLTPICKFLVDWEPIIEARKPLIIAGHSKGAAVAKRFAVELYLSGVWQRIAAVITFGEPRGGDARYATIYNDVLGQRTLRVTNAADPVPWMPGWLAGNRHCGPEGYLPPNENQIVDGPKLWWKIARNCGQIYYGWKNRSDPLVLLTDHHIDSYIRRLDALF